MAPNFKMTPTGVSRVHTYFTISPPFQVKKMVLVLRSHRLFSIWSRTHHDYTRLWAPSQYFPQTVPIVKARFDPQPKKREW